MEVIDTRSDTVTFPTKEMRELIFNCEYGDANYDESTSLNELEALAAQITGQEAALFVPSGCFGNQLCLFTHSEKGQELLASLDSHILIAQAGSAGLISGFQLVTIKPEIEGGLMSPEQVEKNIKTEQNSSKFSPKTGIVAVECPSFYGRIPPLEYYQKVQQVCREKNVKLHCDGARFFNAVAAYDKDPKEIAKYFDSIMFCLSQGLCSPAGSMIVGDKAFIQKAKINKRILGGDMGQVGCLAAPGIFALQEMRFHVKEDNRMAQLLAEQLGKLPFVIVNPDKVDINILFLSYQHDPVKIDVKLLQTHLKKYQIIVGASEPLRIITHHYIREKQVSTIIVAFKDFYESLNKSIN